jgi:hypothetical protein
MKFRPSLTTTLTTLAAAALVSPVTAGTAAPTSSAGTTTEAGGWERSPSTGFESPAGTLCDFALRSETEFDQVYVRTTRTFADGTPRRQEYSGPLVVRLVNESTGASVERDLSGRAVATYRRDGSYDFAIWGPAAVGFHEGDGLRRGYYVLDGYHVVRFAADGTRTVVVDHGTERNVCRALGGVS